MARYIDADALESELFRDGIAGIFLKYPRRTKFTIGEIRGMLQNERIAPTADVAPKSEVAKEIFEEIEKLKHTKFDWSDVVEWDGIAELKKKYTEGKT